MDENEERVLVGALKADIARHLLRLMAERDLQRQQMATIVGTAASTFSNYINRPDNMSPAFIKKLAQAMPDDFSWAWRRWEDIVAPASLRLPDGDIEKCRQVVARARDAAHAVANLLEDLLRDIR